MSKVDPALAEALDIFYAECWQYQDIIGADAKALARADIGADRLTILQRAVHSTKGGAGAFGYLPLHQFAHMVEAVLKAVNAGDLALTAEIRALLVAALDILAVHIAAVTDSGDPPDDARALTDLRALLGVPEVEPAFDPFGFAPLAVDLFDFSDIDDRAAPWRVLFAPAAADLRHGREPLLLLRELARIGGETAAPDLAALPSLNRLDPRGAYLGWRVSLPATVERVSIEACFDFLSPEARLEIARSLDRADTGSADALRA